MIKKILITLLCLCISFNIFAKSNTTVKDEKPIEVNNIFTCYKLNKATLTNGDIIYCVKDIFVKKKKKYDTDKAIDKINECIKNDKLALLNLLGIVYCIDKDDEEGN